MQPLKVYDYLTLARKRVFDWIRPFSVEEYTRTFPIGLGTLGRTLTHVMVSESMYVRRIQGREVPPYAEWQFLYENPPAFGVLEAAWIEQAAVTRAAVAGVRDWSTELEFRVVGDDQPLLITASPSDIFTQLVLHEVHHRAQAMNMLRHLGIAAEDLDFNTLMYKRRPAPP